MKKRFVIQFALTLFLALGLATAFFFALCKGLTLVKSDNMGKLNYLLHDSTHYDCLFLGSSTTLVNTDPLLFDSLTGHFSFNGGIVMMQITEMNMLIPKYVKAHGAPRQLFIGFDDATLSRKSGVWDFAQYFPMVNDSGMKELIALEPKLQLGKCLPPVATFYFPEYLKNLALSGLLNYLRKTEYDIPDRGFTSVSHDPREEMRKIETRFIGSERGWQLLEETLNYCRSEHIAVTFIIPPRYNNVLSPTSLMFLNRLRQLGSRYDIRTFNYLNDKRFQFKELFNDQVHVNPKGAALFTTILATECAER